MKQPKYRTTMFTAISGNSNCQVTGKRVPCLCIKLRSPKRSYYVSRELIIDMLEGVVGEEKPFIIYPRKLVEQMESGTFVIQDVLPKGKEVEDGKQSGAVLPPVLGSDESVLPSDAGKDDGSGTGSGGVAGDKPKAVKKTKKKKAKRKGQKG
jgi:hypothetical protein